MDCEEEREREIRLAGWMNVYKEFVKVEINKVNREAGR